MAEYIEREALLKKITEEYDLEYGGYGEMLIDPCKFAEMVEYAPAADVAPVVHGRWINLTECANEGVYCSVCHKKVYKADYAWCNKKNKVRSSYCPNCGADMRGAE